MTTVFEATGDGPRTHAFVIGVGEYPQCATFEGGGPLGALVRSFGPVKAPPVSARAVSDWLVEHQADNDFAPLGSVELLMSGESTADTPTRPNFETAFHRWYARCDEREDNVALFFFSGHGCANEDQLILLEDFGVSTGNPFNEAVQVGALHRGMGRCRARAQCYFVDACRTVPEELFGAGPIHAYSVIQPVLPHIPADASLFYSTRPGATAPGADDGPTPFTRALLQALEGGAAANTNGDLWEVRTDLLTRAMNAAIQWETGKAPGMTASPLYSTILRHLSRAPVVPFRLGCSPREALGRASLTLSAGGFEASRGPVPAPWEAEVAADSYTFNAHFPCLRYTDTRSRVAIYPPNRTYDLPVQGCGA